MARLTAERETPPGGDRRRRLEDDARAFEVRLAEFMSASTGRETTISGLQRVSGGMSREAWLFETSTGNEPGKTDAYVAMRTARAGLLASDLDAEFRLLQSLQGSPLPVPGVRWFDDGQALDRPTMIMVRSPGRSDHRGAEAGDRDAIRAEFLTHLVTLHSIAPASVDAPGERVERSDAAVRELRRWSDALEAADGWRHPAAAEICRWLSANAPVAERLSIVHGDYRYGNFLHEGATISAILDWELAHVGDPVEDVVWAYRPFRRGTAPNLPFDAWVRAYERASDTTLDPKVVAFYRILAELKTAAIYLTGLKALAGSADADVAAAVPGHLVPCCLRQALLWIDELEAA